MSAEQREERQCPYCPKQYVDTAAYLRHIGKEHEDELP